MAKVSEFTVNVTSSTPSQFAVLATEDNTTITVTPRTATYNYGLTPQTITSQSGVNPTL